VGAVDQEVTVMTDGNRALPDTPEELEAAIAERRAHLADTVDELVGRAQPKALARRSYEDARMGLISATHTEDGRLRTERLAAIGGAALALVGLFALLRRRARRRRALRD
jgi:hypothetical protein